MELPGTRPRRPILRAEGWDGKPRPPTLTLQGDVGLTGERDDKVLKIVPGRLFIHYAVTHTPRHENCLTAFPKTTYFFGFYETR